LLTHNEQRRCHSPQSIVKWHSVSFGGILMSTKRTPLTLPDQAAALFWPFFAMVCGLNCIIFTLTFLDTVSGFISHYWCLNRLSRPVSMYTEFSVIFKARFVIRAVADQILPYVLPWLLEHIHCLIYQNTGLVSAAGRASNLAQTDVSHSCISYVCSATGLVFV